MTDIQADLRGKWENSARSSLSEEATSLLRWEQLKKALQSKRNKVCNVLKEFKTCMLSVVKTLFVFHSAFSLMNLNLSFAHLQSCIHNVLGSITADVRRRNCLHLYVSSN